MTLNRRQFVLASAALATARGQQTHWHSEAMPNMLPEYFARRLNDRAARWDAERAKIRTAEQLLARNRLVGEKLREMMGPFPARTTLAARTVRTIDRPGYRIENVLFQSQPDYWVPANLYVPKGASEPFPAIVMQRGHFNPERMSPDYQQSYCELAANGFVVLAFDPIGQGERRQHYEPGAETFDDLLSPTLEHCVIGGLLSLMGESSAAYFVWDAMRAADYLSARAEVDRTRIGCADHTDTGWSALWFCALDPRIQCASIHAHGRARRWPLDVETWNITDDPEQYLFPGADYGIDLADTMAALAPRPLLVLVEDQNGDFDEDAVHLRECYQQFGAADRFSVETARPGQDWPKKLRAATVQWFRRWLRGETRTVPEADALVEPYSALRVTPKGSLRESSMGQPVYTIIRQRSSTLPPAVRSSEQLRAGIRRALAFPRESTPLDPREGPPERLEGYELSRVEFLSEPGIYVPGRLYRPKRPKDECVVYVSGDVTTFVAEPDDDIAPSLSREDRSADPAHAFAHALARNGYHVLVADVRGIGATRPSAKRRDIRGPYEHLHNSDVAMANMAWSLGDSLFAMRVWDLLRAVEYAFRFGRVQLAGAEMGALWALYAVAIEPRAVGLTIQRGLISYRMLTSHGRYMEATSQFLPGVLKHFDLPQVAGAIAPRPLAILDPSDHMKMAVDSKLAEREYEWTRSAYAREGAAARFHLVFGGEIEAFYLQ